MNTMRTKINRVQYPVGQGGFHSCNINSYYLDDPIQDYVFDYVYDCGTYSLAPDGASRLEHIKRHIDIYAPVDGKVDLLFLSHLDADHYNGAEALCDSKTVARIVLPYFTVEEVCFIIAQQVLLKNNTILSTGYIKNLLDLANGGTRLFGIPVTKVIPATNAPETSIPDRPDDPRPSPLSQADGEAISRAVACSLDPLGQLVPLGDGIASGSPIILAAPAAAPGKKHVLPVILRPWSYMQSPAAVHQMRTTILSCKPLARLLHSKDNITKSDIEELEKYKNQVRKVCQAIIKSAGGTYAGSTNHPNVNSPSLCLYSGVGPSQKTIAPPPRTMGDVNWVATGDALLKQHWIEFEACFKDVLGLTTTYVVPHHGSIKNHRKEFIQAVDVDSTAVISSGYGQAHHPAHAVLAEIHGVKHELAHVTEFDKSGLKQWGMIISW